MTEQMETTGGQPSQKEWAEAASPTNEPQLQAGPDPRAEMDAAHPDAFAQGDPTSHEEGIVGSPPAANIGAAVGGASVQNIQYQALQSNPTSQAASSSNIKMLMDVPLRLTVELGRTRMLVRDVLDLQNGSVVELDRMAGDMVDVFVNDRLVARGEVVVVDDKFGVRINNLIDIGDQEMLTGV